MSTGDKLAYKPGEANLEQVFWEQGAHALSMNGGLAPVLLPPHTSAMPFRSARRLAIQKVRNPDFPLQFPDT